MSEPNNNLGSPTSKAPSGSSRRSSIASASSGVSSRRQTLSSNASLTTSTSLASPTTRHRRSTTHTAKAPSQLEDAEAGDLSDRSSISDGEQENTDQRHQDKPAAPQTGEEQPKDVELDRYRRQAVQRSREYRAKHGSLREQRQQAERVSPRRQEGAAGHASREQSLLASLIADEDVRRQLWLSVRDAEFETRLLPEGVSWRTALEMWQRTCLEEEEDSVRRDCDVQFTVEDEEKRRNEGIRLFSEERFAVVSAAIFDTEFAIRLAIQHEWFHTVTDVASTRWLKELPVSFEQFDEMCQPMLNKKVALPPSNEVRQDLMWPDERSPLHLFFRLSSRGVTRQDGEARPPRTELSLRDEDCTIAASPRRSDTKFSSRPHTAKAARVYNNPPPRTTMQELRDRPRSAPRYRGLKTPVHYQQIEESLPHRIPQPPRPASSGQAAAPAPAPPLAIEGPRRPSTAGKNARHPPPPLHPEWQSSSPGRGSGTFDGATSPASVATEAADVPRGGRNSGCASNSPNRGSPSNAHHDQIHPQVYADMMHQMGGARHSPRDIIHAAVGALRPMELRTVPKVKSGRGRRLFLKTYRTKHAPRHSSPEPQPLPKHILPKQFEL